MASGPASNAVRPFADVALFCGIDFFFGSVHLGFTSLCYTNSQARNSWAWG